MRKKIIIIGAGPGGLSAGMVLAHRGFEVNIYEKQPYLGGRTSALRAGEFTFELGPTFVMMPQVFEEVFAAAGRRLEDYVTFKRLDPLYRLRFGDGRDFTVHFDKAKLRAEIARLFPGDEEGYTRYFADQKRKFDLMYPCLKVPYGRWYHYFRPKLLRAFPYMDNFTSVHDVLARYFQHEDLRMAMAFQSKYLGMSPWDCPGAFTILSYVEHAYGIYHPMGGVHKITEAMAAILAEEGGDLHLGRAVQEVVVERGRAVGVKFEDGTEDRADAVVMNADFASGMTSLIPPRARGGWTDASLARRPYSCSTFMLYLGLDTRYEIPHHNVFFASDYRGNVDDIFLRRTLSAEMSFYVQNACVTDPSLAPPGKSTIYVLVPVPNLNADIDWDDAKEAYRAKVLSQIAARTEMRDIEAHIETERVITPKDWERGMGVYKGAVFNLAHTLGQMLYLRPHNNFRELPGLFLVGGGTHPGSGLPTILESGRIAADLISGG